MDTNISSHVFGTNLEKTAFMKTSIFVWRWYQEGEINPAYFEDFFLVDAFCVGPFWDDVIQHPLAKIPGHFVDHHELFHWVEHFMVFGRGLSQISGMVTDSNSVLFSVRSSIFNMNDWLCTKRLRCQWRYLSHVVDDCGDVTENGSVEQAWDDHHTTRESFFVVCLGRNVSEPYRCHAGHGEVKGCQVPDVPTSTFFFQVKFLKIDDYPFEGLRNYLSST